jgi:hypothetical protein
MRVHSIVSLLTSAAVLACSVPAYADSGSWLDKKPLPSWNVPGVAIPKAAKTNSGNLSRCTSTIRKPQTPADRMVASAGWKLFGPYQLYADTAIVMGESDADGMCRPAGYQGFVFVRGRFAGTLSPKPVDDRIDGAFAIPMLYDGSTFTVTYQRYTDKDPLCCPSRNTAVTFKVVQQHGVPVVVTVDAGTTKNSSQ